LCEDGGHHGLDKHAIAHGTIKITLSLDATIVLARLLLQLDAYPLADLKVRIACEADNAFAAIVELDSLPRLKIRHYDMMSRS
jgi:hypothetical protein